MLLGTFTFFGELTICRNTPIRLVDEVSTNFSLLNLNNTFGYLLLYLQSIYLWCNVQILHMNPQFWVVFPQHVFLYSIQFLHYGCGLHNEVNATVKSQYLKMLFVL